MSFNLDEAEDELTCPEDELVLAAALLSMEVRPFLPELLERVAADMFADPHIGLMWAAAQTVQARNEPVTRRTVLTVQDSPAIRERIRRVQGEPVSPTAVVTAAGRVLDTYRSRRLVQGLKRIALACSEKTYSEALDFAHRELADLEQGSQPPEIRSFSDALDGWWEWMDAPASNDLTVPTPWPELNDLFAGGLKPGRSYVVGGRPGEGKSIALLNIAKNAAENGHPVAVYSVEMGEIELISRIMASGAMAQSAQINRRVLDADNRMRLDGYGRRHRGMPLLLVDKSDLTMDYINATARTLKRSEGLQVVFVDYLQLMRESDSRKARERQVAEISRALKVLARELDIAVVVACQVNRNANGRKPSLGDLRESGAIEQDADAVVLLHHEKDENDQPNGLVSLIVAKNRTGRIGETQLPWRAWAAAMG